MWTELIQGRDTGPVGIVREVRFTREWCQVSRTCGPIHIVRSVESVAVWLKLNFIFDRATKVPRVPRVGLEFHKELEGVWVVKGNDGRYHNIVIID